MNFAAARRNMVNCQILTNRVTHPQLIDALEQLPRELFVPKQWRSTAYLDDDVDLGAGRYLMEPMVFARLLQGADIRPTEVVLDVGCATGYSSAVLARLAGAVVALEADSDLVSRAGAALAELGVDTVAVVKGPLAKGDASHGPYDVIILEGSVEQIPDSLTRQLADGGRLVAVVGAPGEVGRATLLLRVGEVFSQRILFDASIAPLPGFESAPRFVL
ncbi:MAG TPA: protein-L-isoaspartate O-methyltransferase [Rhodospirillaceae bacterium]|nr:protein-L-isoaspartate O-methyltransferase [Rhodospirillaceae bacterium]